MWLLENPPNEYCSPRPPVGLNGPSWSHAARSILLRRMAEQRWGRLARKRLIGGLSKGVTNKKTNQKATSDATSQRITSTVRRGPSQAHCQPLAACVIRRWVQLLITSRRWPSESEAASRRGPSWRLYTIYYSWRWWLSACLGRLSCWWKIPVGDPGSQRHRRRCT